MPLFYSLGTCFFSLLCLDSSISPLGDTKTFKNFFAFIFQILQISHAGTLLYGKRQRKCACRQRLANGELSQYQRAADKSGMQICSINSKFSTSATHIMLVNWRCPVPLAWRIQQHISSTHHDEQN